MLPYDENAVRMTIIPGNLNPNCERFPPLNCKYIFLGLCPALFLVQGAGRSIWTKCQGMKKIGTFPLKWRKVRQEENGYKLPDSLNLGTSYAVIFLLVLSWYVSCSIS